MQNIVQISVTVQIQLKKHTEQSMHINDNKLILIKQFLFLNKTVKSSVTFLKKFLIVLMQ